MKHKLLLILLLIAAIVTASTAGTLSYYTAAIPKGNVDVAVDMTNFMYLVPDTSKLPSDAVVINSRTVSGKDNIQTNRCFAAFYGKLTQQSTGSALTFDSSKTGTRIKNAPGMSGKDAYLLYFAPDAVIRMSDGTPISLQGFYYIEAGNGAADLFSKSLYQLENGTYLLRPDNGSLVLCSNVTDIAAYLKIPLRVATAS